MPSQTIDKPGTASKKAAATASRIQFATMAVDDALAVRVGTLGDGPKGDVLYLHGYADRLDNHQPLFDEFVEQGLRIISFDYPSHGETSGKPLNTYDFAELAVLAGEVERAKANTGPLYLAGWSTGGLLAVRIAQGIAPNALSRPIAGMALFAPGVAVRPVVKVSEDTLTRNRNPPHVAGPQPSTTADTFPFPLLLTANATLSAMTQFPSSIPTLIIVGGEDEDKYVDTRGVVDWVEKQRRGGARIVGLRCAGAFHELDNEPEPTGGIVRDAAARFLASQGTATIKGTGDCQPF